MDNILKNITVSNGDGNTTNIFNNGNITYYNENPRIPINVYDTIKIYINYSILKGCVQKNDSFGIYEYEIFGEVYAAGGDIDNIDNINNYTIYIKNCFNKTLNINNVLSVYPPVTIFSSPKFNSKYTYISGSSSSGSGGPYFVIPAELFKELKQYALDSKYSSSQVASRDFNVRGYIQITNKDILDKTPPPIVIS